MPTEPDRRPLLAAVVAVTAAIDLIVLAAFHIVQPGVDVVAQATSSYVHGAFGGASAVAAAAVGLGALALSLAGRRILPDRPGTRSGLLLLTLFGLAKLAQAFFPIDATGVSTASGVAHNVLGNVAFFVLPVAVFLLTLPFATATGHHESRWATVARWAVVVATGLTLAGDSLGVFGLAQRLYLVVAALWSALLATWLWRPKTGTGPIPVHSSE
jgi:hypothetical protein